MVNAGLTVRTINRRRILNALADTIKKIAGDDTFTKSTITLKAISQTIKKIWRISITKNGYGSRCKTATNATNAKLCPM